MMKGSEAHLPHCISVGGHMGGAYESAEKAKKMAEVMAKHHSIHHGESPAISSMTNNLESGLKGMPEEGTRGMGEMYSKLANE